MVEMANWHFCIICLSDLRKVKVEGEEDGLVSDGKGVGDSVKFLMQYLLCTNANTYDGILEDVLKLVGIASCGTKVEATGDVTQEEEGVEKCSSKSKVLKVCGDCEQVGGKLQELHQGLEELKRKIKKQDKKVNETIIRSSGWLGGISGGEEAFENFSKKFCGGDESSGAKQTFETLKAFQTAVAEAGLERESNSGPFIHSFPKKGAITELVKTEPEYSESFEDNQNDDTGSLHLDSFIEEFVGNCNSPLDFGNFGGEQIFSESGVTTSRKRKIRRISSSSASSIVKTDHANLGSLEPLACSSKTTEVRFRGNRIKKQKRKAQPKSEYEKRKLKYRKKTGDVHKKYKKKSTYLGKTAYRPLIPPLIKKISQVFICDTCGAKHRYSSAFEQHLRSHEAEKKTFQCDECNKSFTTKQYRDFHKDQHVGHHKLFCDVCKCVFSLFEFDEHLKTHVDTIFPCSLCSHSSSSMEKHLLHVSRQHFGRDFKCRVCGCPFKKKQHLLHHLHVAHQAVDKIECEAEGCDKTFVTEVAYKRHKSVHTDQFVCTKCCKRFTSLSSLQIHQQLHTGKRQFQCDQCSEAFTMKNRLAAHMVSKHGAERFKCDICGKDYTSLDGVSFHKKLVHNGWTPNENCCPICNKRCVTPNRLQRHMESHSTEKKYMCEMCGKSFQTSNTCNQHKRIHGEKKYACTHCPKAFTKPQYLEMHVRTHTGEKPFSCDLCGKGFSQKGSVNIHRKKCPLLSSNQTANQAL